MLQFFFSVDIFMKAPSLIKIPRNKDILYPKCFTNKDLNPYSQRIAYLS